MALVSRSGPFAALSSLRLAFALRHSPCPRSYSPGYHSSILCPRFVIRITIQQRPSKPPFHSTPLFQQQQSCESFARRTAPILCGRRTACFAQRVVELICSSRCTAKEPARL